MHNMISYISYSNAQFYIIYIYNNDANYVRRSKPLYIYSVCV